MNTTEQIVQSLNVKALQAGDELQSYTKAPITKVQLVQYAGASGDFNPLHTDDAFAQSIGMPGVIAHGMLIMAFLGEYVIKLVSDEATVKSFSMRFGAMTFPGDVITCGGSVKEINGQEIKLLLEAKKQDGKVVGTGEAVIVSNQ
ncbi:MAG: MaoC/PaaZ C-terminal domain-containing protein [Bacillus sp. (in: firmicutes)]